MLREACTLGLIACEAAWAIAAPGVRFDALPAEEQRQIRADCAPPPPSQRRGPYSTPMYYLMHKGYAYEGHWDADPAKRCYDKLNGQKGPDWGTWKLDRNRPDWQEAMIADWAELGLNSTHLNVYPVGGRLAVDPDWEQALVDFVSLSVKYGLKVGVRLDAPDETKLWSVHPGNPQSQRAEFLGWVSRVAKLLKGRTVYYILGDELPFAEPAKDLPAEAWTSEMYLAYFKDVATAIKQVDPEAKVGMFAASSGDWISVKKLLKGGYDKLGDAVAINHYDYHTVPSYFADRDQLAPDKLFLTSGVGYVSNATVSKRYPEGDAYTPEPSEESQGAQIVKSIFTWWDLGADVAPYYLTLRNWIVEGREYPRWFGFLGFEDYVVAEDRLSVKRHPPWYAFQAVALTFYDRKHMTSPSFDVTSSEPVSVLRAYEHETPAGKELLVMAWNDDGDKATDLAFASDQYRYPVKVSLADYRTWESLDSEVQSGGTKIRLTAGRTPTIVRLVRR